MLILQLDLIIFKSNAFYFIVHSYKQALMTDETIGNVPILILGNKIDKPEAISEEKLRELFGLYGQTTGKVRRAYILFAHIFS